MSKEVFKSEILYTKLLSTLEVIFPSIIHMLNLSLVEVVIHGKIFYVVKSDFASMMFMLSIAMIFQAFRKKIMPEATKIPMKMLAIVRMIFLISSF